MAKSDIKSTVRGRDVYSLLVGGLVGSAAISTALAPAQKQQTVLSNRHSSAPDAAAVLRVLAPGERYSIAEMNKKTPKEAGNVPASQWPLEDHCLLRPEILKKIKFAIFANSISPQQLSLQNWLEDQKIKDPEFYTRVMLLIYC